MNLNFTYNEDWISALKKLPDNSVDCIVTSPPYWNLRNYNVEGQLGLEDTPEEFIQKLVEGFRECRRVLKPTGTLWVNIGDSYANGPRERTAQHTINKTTLKGGFETQLQASSQKNKVVGDLKRKDLIGIPWTLAFALRKDGWYLRQDIIWSKKNCMPESIHDRCTKSHEYIFLLSKTDTYYFDSNAIAEPIAESTANDYRMKKEKYTVSRPERGFNGKKQRGSGMLKRKDGSNKRNKRSVWHMKTGRFKEAHFATFPPELITPCILAGCPPGGIVLDPFMGAHTTALVARKLERNYIGIEINPEYIRIGEKRLENELGLFHENSC